MFGLIVTVFTLLNLSLYFRFRKIISDTAIYKINDLDFKTIIDFVLWQLMQMILKHTLEKPGYFRKHEIVKLQKYLK